MEREKKKAKKRVIARLLLLLLVLGLVLNLEVPQLVCVAVAGHHADVVTDLVFAEKLLCEVLEVPVGSSARGRREARGRSATSANVY